LLSIASAFSLISFMAGEKWLTNALTFGKISQEAACELHFFLERFPF
jgi:hypothetical protein